MSKFILPAQKMTKELQAWLTVAFNDHRAALKAVQEKDEEEHKGALMISACYLFALSSAHKAIFSTEDLPEEINSPEARVLYFANQQLNELVKADGADLADVKTADDSGLNQTVSL